jgi:hypothetical protein
VSPAAPDRDAIVAKLLADLIEAIGMADANADARHRDVMHALRSRVERTRPYLALGIAVGFAAGLLVNGALR